MHPPSLRHAAPSPSLLKFLRAQAAPSSALLSPRCCAKLSTRRDAFFSTTTRAPSTLNACVLQLSAPSCSAAALLTPSISFHQGGCYSRQSHARLWSFQTSRRTFSNTNPARSWCDFPWSKKRKATYGRLQPDDLPQRKDGFAPDETGNMARVLRPINEPRLRCTEFDENGNVTLVNGEFRKSELIAKYGLLPRDLRKIDSAMLPHILVRPSAILLNLLHLRVLIKHNRVLVFDAYGTTNSYTQSIFMYDLEGRLRQKDMRQNGHLPYEFRALEAVLLSVTSGLESEFEGVREPVVRVLRELEEDIDRDKLRYLLIYSKKLGSFEQQARLVRDALEELLEADDDLSAMYLSEKATGALRHEHEHTEVEMLLESYHKVSDEIVQAAENLVSNIRNTEEIVKAILDANRNSLMLLDLKFAVWTLGLAAGTFIAALYGMNLKNFIEESDAGFWGVSIACAVFTIITTTFGLGKLRRVQRVSMWGEHGMRNASKGSWRDIGEVGSALLAPKNPRVPPVGVGAAIPPSPPLNNPAADNRREKLRRIRDAHAAQAQGVYAEVQAARRAGLLKDKTRSLGDEEALKQADAAETSQSDENAQESSTKPPSDGKGPT
ncbi:putative magnesium ion transporter [Phyllosticta citribraziliensis]|uniref:Magnesium transporter n=1 Tax=Phyllosticta citribraziliensis TaxID=989973 RepID=A0ABR1LND4_9PEZI